MWIGIRKFGGWISGDEGKMKGFWSDELANLYGMSIYGQDIDYLDMNKN